MAKEYLTATGRGEKALTEGVTTRPGINIFESTVAMSAAATADSTYTMARVPMDARLTLQSVIAITALADTGSPTLDVGLAPVDENFSAIDPDALNDGINAKTASTSISLLKTASNVSKYVWELAGESENPGGFADVVITLADANCNTGGTISASLVYVM